jgi:F-type H+-transporting ATPase subunit a
MPHGMSWFSFLPGYQNLEAYVQNAYGPSWINHQAATLQHVVAALLVFAFMLVLSLRARAQLAQASDGGVVPPPQFSARNFIEVISEALYGQLKALCGSEGRRFFPVVGALGLFIFFSNVLGLIPGFVPPTDNLNTTLACGLFVFLYYNYHGLRVNGFGHIVHMMNPMGNKVGWFLAPLMFPIELVGHVARPLSLSLRLMGNMMGDHAVLGIFVSIFPLLLPLPFFILGFMVCIIQTVVFCLLSMVYLSLSVAHADHGDEAHAH